MAGICDMPVVASVCDTVGEAGASLVSAPFEWLAQAMGSAASWMFESVWALFDSTTLVDLTDPGYLGVYNIIFGIAVVLMLIFFSLQLITGMIRREPGALTRAALGLGKSVIGSFLLITLTTVLLEITDQLCIGIVQATGNTLETMGAKISVLVAGLATINIAAPGAGAIVTIFLAFLAMAAAATVWFTLLIRKALILVAVVLGPIALSGASWDATKGWFTKWASFVLALIVSKLVIVVVFLVAVNQMNTPIDLDLESVANPVAGIVLMFIAAFAPYMVYKLIAFAGFDMHHVMSAEQEAKQSLNRPIPVPGRGGAPSPQKILNAGKSSQGSGTAPTPSSGGGASAASSPTAAPTGAGGGAAGASSGATAGGSAGSSAAGGAAAAGPVALAAVAAAKLAKGAAQAGPKAGASIGQAADSHTTSASAPSAPTPRPEPRSGTEVPLVNRPTDAASPTAPREAAPQPRGSA